MPNMSHCRFTNTLQALRDCYDNIDETDLSNAEERAREKLIKLCTQISDDCDPDANRE